MLIDRHATGLLLFGCSFVGACGGDSGGVGSASAAAPPSATESSSGVQSSVAPSATASGATKSAVAEKFAQPIPPGLKPAAIYVGEQQSGLIALLPTAFNMDYWGFKVGLHALSTPSPGVVLANLSFEVSTDAKPLVAGPPTLTARCDGRWFKHGTWTESEPVEMTDGKALVWLGVDASEAGRAGRRAYLLEGIFDKKRVSACGSWDPAHPELELAVVTALQSIRAGSAPRGNYEN